MIDYKKVMEKEGDEKFFQYKGYDAAILRATTGHLCGYVEIPNRHKLYGLDYNQINELYDYEFPAHGGLTYAGHRLNDHRYFIGFDCGHMNDISPLFPVGFEGSTYKDMEFVENNIKEIIDYIQ